MRISLRLGIAAMLCLVASGWSVPTTAKDKVQQKDIPIVKTVDKSSPKLMMNKSTALDKPAESASELRSAAGQEIPFIALPSICSRSVLKRSVRS